MTDIHDKGYSYVQLFDPEIVFDAWDDIDQYELHRLVDERSNEPLKLLSPPRAPKFIRFVREIEKNMPQCWERYGKKYMKPEMLEQHLDLFPFSEKAVVRRSTDEHIWIWDPLVPVSQNQGLPTFMEGSHRHKEDGEDRLYYPIIKPGYALMFDARLRTNVPRAGGGVILARVYDVTKTSSQAPKAGINSSRVAPGNA